MSTLNDCLTCSAVWVFYAKYLWFSANLMIIFVLSQRRQWEPHSFHNNKQVEYKNQLIKYWSHLCQHWLIFLLAQLCEYFMVWCKSNDYICFITKAAMTTPPFFAMMNKLKTRTTKQNMVRFHINTNWLFYLLSCCVSILMGNIWYWFVKSVIF